MQEIRKLNPDAQIILVVDGNAALVRYADCLGQAGLDVFEEGYLSEDLASLCDPKELKEMPENGKLMKLIRARLETLLA